MIKTIELIVVAALLVFAFFAGVKYSDSVKNHASWLFEIKDEEEVELPDLSNENGADVSVTIEENAAPAVGQDVVPMDNINTNPQQPQAAPAQ